MDGTRAGLALLWAMPFLINST
ncbi:MAG: hypothetical protein RL597_1351, partial [Pseudomonadota bacterium]